MHAHSYREYISSESSHEMHLTAIRKISTINHNLPSCSLNYVWPNNWHWRTETLNQHHKAPKYYLHDIYYVSETGDVIKSKVYGNYSLEYCWQLLWENSFNNLNEDFLFYTGVISLTSHMCMSVW